jgi:hypothetical protein
MTPEVFEIAKHYPIVSDWWARRKWPVIPTESLTPNGIIVQNGDNYICAAWLYKTDSNLCWMEFFIGSPDASKRNLSNGLDMLIESLTALAKNMGFKFIFTSMSHKGLLGRMKKHGFNAMDSGMTNLIRSI